MPPRLPVPSARSSRFDGWGLQSSLAEGERGDRREAGWGKFASLEAGPGRGSDHSGVVGGEGQRGEGHAEVASGGFGGEAGTKLAVGGNSAGYEDAGGAEGFLGSEGFLHQVADDGALETGDEVEGLRVAGGESGFDGGVGRGIGSSEERLPASFGFGAEIVELDVAENGGLDS